MGHMGHDMSTMDHGMDHTMNGSSTMPTTGMSGGGHHMMMMNMYFTTDWKHSYLFFESWQLHELWHLIIACILLGVVAAMYEGLKVLRNVIIGSEVLLVKFGSSRSGGSYNTSNKGPHDSIGLRICSCTHLLQTLLHMIQISVSYFLMLAVMTFQVYLCIAVVVGAGLGYFLFGWKRAIIHDVNEHCH